jgi:hypothetical protein
MRARHDVGPRGLAGRGAVCGHLDLDGQGRGRSTGSDQLGGARVVGRAEQESEDSEAGQDEARHAGWYYDAAEEFAGAGVRSAGSHGDAAGVDECGTPMQHPGWGTRTRFRG